MAEATRREVLGLYRRVFRLARRWQAASGRGEDTAEEQQYILHEARTLFRKNRDVSGPRGFGAVPVSPWSVLSISPPPRSSPTRLCLLLGPVFLCAPAREQAALRTRPGRAARGAHPSRRRLRLLVFAPGLPAPRSAVILRAGVRGPPRATHLRARAPRALQGRQPAPRPQPLPLLGAPSLPALRGQPAWEAAQPTARPLVKLPVPCQGCVPSPSPPRRPEEASHTLQVPFLHRPSENSLSYICLERSY